MARAAAHAHAQPQLKRRRAGRLNVAAERRSAEHKPAAVPVAPCCARRHPIAMYRFAQTCMREALRWSSVTRMRQSARKHAAKIIATRLCGVLTAFKSLLGISRSAISVAARNHSPTRPLVTRIPAAIPRLPLKNACSVSSDKPRACSETSSKCAMVVKANSIQLHLAITERDRPVENDTDAH